MLNSLKLITYEYNRNTFQIEVHMNYLQSLYAHRV